MKFSLFVIITCIIFFACKRQSKKNNLKEIPNIPEKTIEKTNSLDTTLLDVWMKFITIVKKGNYKLFKKIALDSIDACGNNVSTNTFINKCFSEVFSDSLLDRSTNPSKIDFTEKEVISSYFAKKLVSQIKNAGETFKIRQVQVLMIESEPEGPWTMTFDFIETRNGYRFYGCDSYGGPICCQ
jgi:hypothetical protein